MDWIQVVLFIVFIVATIVGYFLIGNIPSLLHSPLMSGMNALSGVIVIGAMTTAGITLKNENETVAAIFGCVAVALAMINVVGGFSVTDRMLKMFDKKSRN